MLFPCNLMEFAKSFIDIHCQSPSSHFPLQAISSAYSNTVLCDRYWQFWYFICGGIQPTCPVLRFKRYAGSTRRMTELLFYFSVECCHAICWWRLWISMYSVDQFTVNMTISQTRQPLLFCYLQTSHFSYLGTRYGWRQPWVGVLIRSPPVKVLCNIKLCIYLRRKSPAFS